MQFDAADPIFVAGSKTLVIYYRGNCESTTEFEQEIKEVSSSVSVAFSPVLETPEKTMSAALAFYDKVVENLSGFDVFLYGNSLGGHFASYVASKRECKALILETPLISVKECIENYLGRMSAFVPGTPASGRMELAPLLENIKCPVHVMGAVDDEVIPSMEPIKSLVETLTMVKCKHNDTRTMPEWKPWVSEIIA